MAVGKERISTEDHPWTEDPTVPSHQATMPPTLPWVQVHPTRPCRPADKRRLSSNQRGIASQWMLGMRVLTRTTGHLRGWCSGFSPRSHTRTGAETEQSSAVLTNGFLLLYVLDNSSSAKDSGCCKPGSKESSVPSTREHPFTPTAAQDRRSRHTVRAQPHQKAPLQAISSSLSFWVCWGYAFA